MPIHEVPVVSGLPPRNAGRRQRRRVVFVLNPRAGSLEFMGPVQVFDEAQLFLDAAGRADLAYQVEFVTLEPGPVYRRKGFTIDCALPYQQLRGEVDTLVFQAADEADYCLGDEKFIAWVGRMSGRVRRIASICTGSFILAQAGVLDGRRATTHWCACNDFRARYPNVRLEPESIYVKDGHVYTSAGATAGIDLTIALIEEDFGRELALRVSQGLVMYLRRPGNQAQFSVQVAPHVAREPWIEDIQSYVAANLRKDLRVETLAEKAHMSARNFTRLFERNVGVTPGRYVEQCRLEFARQYLEQSELPLTDVARRCGYSTADGLRLAFDRHLGVSPREYRNRFATSNRTGG